MNLSLSATYFGRHEPAIDLNAHFQLSVPDEGSWSPAQNGTEWKFLHLPVETAILLHKKSEYEE